MSTIKTWEERHKPGVNFTWTPTPITNAMQAEITELRAALAARATPAQPEPEAVTVIGALRRAMDNAQVPDEFRAALVGYFSNEWNRLLQRSPSPASAAQPSPSSVGDAIRALLDEQKTYAQGRDGDWWRGYGAALHWIGKAIEEMENKA